MFPLLDTGGHVQQLLQRVEVLPLIRSCSTYSVASGTLSPKDVVPACDGETGSPAENPNSVEHLL